MTFSHGHQTRVLMDKWNLSPWLKSSNLALTVEMADATALTDLDATGIPGHRGATYDLSGMMSIDTTSAHIDLLRVLQAEEATPTPHNVLSVAYRGFAVGEPIWGGLGYMSGYSPQQPFNNVVMLNPKFMSDDVLSLGRSLHDILAGATANGNSSAVDNAASSAHGAIGILHVIANDRNGALVAKIQHSADNSTWADLITFSSVAGAGLTSPGQRVATSATATVNRYVRGLWTVGGSTGSVTFALVVYRLVSLSA